MQAKTTSENITLTVELTRKELAEIMEFLRISTGKHCQDCDNDTDECTGCHADSACRLLRALRHDADGPQPKPMGKKGRK